MPGQPAALPRLRGPRPFFPILEESELECYMDDCELLSGGKQIAMRCRTNPHIIHRCRCVLCFCDRLDWCCARQNDSAIEVLSHIDELRIGVRDQRFHDTVELCIRTALEFIWKTDVWYMNEPDPLKAVYGPPIPPLAPLSVNTVPQVDSRTCQECNGTGIVSHSHDPEELPDCEDDKIPDSTPMHDNTVVEQIAQQPANPSFTNLAFRNKNENSNYRH